jgi:hypothetical protein
METIVGFSLGPLGGLIAPIYRRVIGFFVVYVSILWGFSLVAIIAFDSLPNDLTAVLPGFVRSLGLVSLILWVLFGVPVLGYQVAKRRATTEVSSWQAIQATYFDARLMLAFVPILGSSLPETKPRDPAEDPSSSAPVEPQ